MGTLVLSRKPQERVVIRNTETGDEVLVTVVRFSGDGTVKLGFDAPAKYKILRTELENESRD